MKGKSGFNPMEMMSKMMGGEGFDPEEMMSKWMGDDEKGTGPSDRRGLLLCGRVFFSPPSQNNTRRIYQRNDIWLVGIIIFHWRRS